MPHQGQAFDSNNRTRPDTEHGRWTQSEIDSPVHRLDQNYQPRGREGRPPRDNLGYVVNGSRPADPNCHYTQAEMREDDRTRTRQFLNQNRTNRPPPSGAVADGSAPAGAAPGTAAGAAKPNAPAGNASSSSGGSPQVITGSDAADCISNFKEMNEKAMQTKCAQDVEANRSVADGGPGRTAAEGQQHRATLRAAHESATQQHRDAERASERARRVASARQTQYKRARAAVERDPFGRTPEGQEAIAHLNSERRRYAQSIAQRRAAEEREQTLLNARRTAARNHNTVREADCLAQQGANIRSGNARVDGRSPGVMNDEPQSLPLAFADLGSCLRPVR